MQEEGIINASAGEPTSSDALNRLEIIVLGEGDDGTAIPDLLNEQKRLIERDHVLDGQSGYGGV
jgi:hypothetical protein